MCGIAGILDLHGCARRFEGNLTSMQQALMHRGPDDQHRCVTEDIACAHTRLAIIDLESGRQPFTDPSRKTVLVANGEIYNYRDLRKRLEAQGHRFSSSSDCETILHLYHQYGPDCVRYLDGMFAFALWDAKRQVLLLARDRFGIKPLCFARLKDAVCFASEVTAVMASGLLPRQIDARAMHAFLAFSYVPGSMCAFEGVEKLQPAEIVLFNRDHVARERYWRPRPCAAPTSQADAAHELEGRLERCVSAHLVADVPVAAFLSGGVDSSAIVAMARRSTAIDTFCVSFPESGLDEAPFARRVASHLGTQHHELTISIDPDRSLDEVVEFMDEPFADSSAIPTFAVCRAARALAKVVLSGVGGDEVFGGYTGRYRAAALKSVVPRPRWWADLLRRVPPWRNGKRSSTPQMLDRADMPEAERFVLERQITTPQQRSALMGEAESRRWELGLSDSAAAILADTELSHPVHRALWLDLQTALPDDMLTKMDRMSMAHGLEVRVPFLDHHLVEFALSLPPGWLVSPLPVEGKRVLRRAVRPMLPPHVLDRPKQGFVAPLSQWLRGGLLDRVETAFRSSDSRLSAWMNLDAIAAIRRPLRDSPQQDLYALLVLEHWLRRRMG